MKLMSLRSLAAAAAALLLTACSGGSSLDQLLQRIPAGVDYVAVGDGKTVIESAGGSIEGSTIKLPSYVTDEIPADDMNDIEEGLSLLEESGVDVTTCALAGDYDDGAPTVLFIVDDEEKFVAFLEDNGFDEEKERDGVKIYRKLTYESEYSGEKASYVGIVDGYAYFMPEVWDNDTNAPRVISRFISDAAESDYASTPYGEYLAEGNTAGVGLRIPKKLKSVMSGAGMGKMTKVCGGVFCFKGDITGNALSIKAKWLDDEGNTLSAEDLGLGVKNDARINADVLAYLGASESLVWANSLDGFDWSAVFDPLEQSLYGDDRMVLATIKGYLTDVDGTVAAGVGVSGGINGLAEMSRSRNILKNLPLTLVVEMKKGKATSAVANLKELAAQAGVGEYISSTERGVRLDIPQQGTIYLEAPEGDVLVLSTRPVKKGEPNATVKNIDFGNYSTVIALVLSKNHELMKQFHVDNSLRMAFTQSNENLEMQLLVEIDGDDSKGFVETLLRACLGVYEHVGDIKATIGDAFDELNRSSYDDYDWPADTTAVEYPVEDDDYDWAVDSTVVAPVA